MEKRKIMAGIEKIKGDRQLLLIIALAAAVVSILAAGTFAFLRENTSELVNSFTGAEKPTEVVLLPGQDFNAEIKEANYNTEDTSIEKIIFGDLTNKDYAAAIEGVAGINVDVDRKGLCKAYKVENTPGGKYAVYVLTDEKVPVYANESSSYMFSGLKGLTFIEDWGTFNTENVESMEKMFSGCENVTELDLRAFNTAKVKNMSYMFSVCKKLEMVDLSSFKTDTVESMSYMFDECHKLKRLDLSTFDTSNVRNMGSMFLQCSGLEALDLSTFDTSNVGYMEGMFGSCKVLKNLDLSSFNTSKVTSMSKMFFGCSSLPELDLSSFDTGNVWNMSGMFFNCSKLTSAPEGLDGFNTSKVKNMSQMFFGCSGLSELDLSNFDTSSVTGMGQMFRECRALSNLNLSSFDTSNVTDMGGMFYSCSSLTELDLSNFNMQKVTKTTYTQQYDIVGTYGMFRDCSQLTTIYVSEMQSDWYSIGKITSDASADMFLGCMNLKGTIHIDVDDEGNETPVYCDYDAAHVDIEYAGVATEESGGYFTLKGGIARVMMLNDVSPNDPAVSGNNLDDTKPEGDTETGNGTDNTESNSEENNSPGNYPTENDPAILPEGSKLEDTAEQSPNPGGGDAAGAEGATRSEHAGTVTEDENAM